MLMHNQNMFNSNTSESVLKDERRKNWFWDHNEVFDSNLSPYGKLVRLFLARCADGDRVSWPSYNRIARVCGISRRTAQKAVDELEAKGWIKKYERRKNSNENDSNIYVLCNPPENLSNTINESKNNSCEKRGGAPGTPPCNEITGGGALYTPPCNVVTGGGGVSDALGGAPCAPKQYPDNNTNIVVVEDGQQDKNSITKEAVSSTVENDGAAFDLPGSDEEEGCRQDLQAGGEGKTKGKLLWSWEKIREDVRAVAGDDITVPFAKLIAKKYTPEQLSDALKELGNQLEKGLKLEKGIGHWLNWALQNDIKPLPDPKSALKEETKRESQNNNNKTPRASPGKGYDDLEWYPPEEREVIRKRKQELIKNLYMS